MAKLSLAEPPHCCPGAPFILGPILEPTLLLPAHPHSDHENWKYIQSTGRVHAEALQILIVHHVMPSFQRKAEHAPVKD